MGRQKKEKNTIKKNKMRRTGGGLLGFLDKAGVLIRKPLREGNYMLIATVLLLTVFGVAMVFSAGFYSSLSEAGNDPYLYLRKQGFYAVTGFGIMLFVANIDYHYYQKYNNIACLLSILLLVMLIPFGVTANGATRWLNFGITITPSEISKVCVILWTAGFMCRHPGASRRFRDYGLITIIAVMVVHALLIMWQPNLSTAIVVCAIMVALMVVDGMNLMYVLGMIVGGGAMVAVLSKVNPHWMQRITSFLDPFADAQGDGYQVSQGIIALGNGGLTGLGFGNSVSKNLYLPEPQNDFILAIIGEELGFITIMILVMLYMYLLYQCVSIAMKARDRLGCYIGTGISVMLALHVILNIAVVSSSMPATGITLPFISYGGTSMWMFMAGMGIMLNISRGQTVAQFVTFRSSPEKVARERRRKQRMREMEEIRNKRS